MSIFTTHLHEDADVAIGQTKALVVNDNTQSSVVISVLWGCYGGMALTHTTPKHEPSDLNPAMTSSGREKTINTL